MRKWRVAGGVVESHDDVLLVRNRRRDGSHDWSTPGGVVDPGEETLGALTREVAEETGLVVHAWTGPVYLVDVLAPDLGWHLEVEVFTAPAPAGELQVDDPDGIVVEARWFPSDACADPLDGNHRWVSEPLVRFLRERWADPWRFRYVVEGDRLADLTVLAVGDGPADEP